MEVRQRLKTKQWGTQTQCPDDENHCGYFEPIDRNHLKLFDAPSLDAEEVNIGTVWRCWGWDKYVDHKERLTWINISDSDTVWAVFHAPFYTYDDEDDEDDDEDDDDNYDQWKIKDENPQTPKLESSGKKNKRRKISV